MISLCKLRIAPLCSLLVAAGWVLGLSAEIMARDQTMPRPVRVNHSRVAKGASLFRANGCGDCHFAGGMGDQEGIRLDGIKNRRSRQFIVDHLKNPEEHVEKNAKAFKGEPNLMPDPNLTQQEIGLIADYLITLPAKPGH